MNREQKKRLARLRKARDELAEIQMEEQEAYDNLPESIQAGRQGESLQENADQIQSAIDEIDYTLERADG